MTKRTLMPGRGTSNRIIFSYKHNGDKHEGICSKDDWKIYELKYKLFLAGAKEDDIEELYDAAFSLGKEQEELDAHERERW